MVAVAAAFPSPEHIDDNKPPGVRLSQSTKRHGGSYSKPIQGNLIAIEVGIEAMRARCKHFEGWLAELRGRAGG
jgi:hypothetical protein